MSLVPSATEIVAALGMTAHLAGISHECDYPPEIRGLPAVTRCLLPEGERSSAETDRLVKAALESAGTLYVLDEARLRRLRPQVLLTQQLCDVCAVGHGSVAAAASSLPEPPRVVSLDPATLGEVLEGIRRVGEVLGVPERAERLLADLEFRIEAVRRGAAGASRPRCLLLEWLDPPFCSGHWNPELVELAGGEEVLGRVGEPSRSIPWEAVREAAPEVLVLACCGYSAERTLQDVPELRRRPGWERLPAAAAGRVYAVDANAYFTRPGPRLVDSLEILAGILHPDRFAGRFPERGVLRVPAEG